MWQTLTDSSRCSVVSVLTAARAAAAAQAEPTVTIGWVNVDGGEWRLADGTTVGASEEGGGRLADVVSTLLSTVDRIVVSSGVRWLGGVRGWLGRQSSRRCV